MPLRKTLSRVALATIAFSVLATGTPLTAFAAPGPGGVDWDVVATELGAPGQGDNVQTNAFFVAAKISAAKNIPVGKFIGSLKPQEGDDPSQAESFYQLAVRAGEIIDQKPAAGSVAYFAEGTHLAIVTAVNPDDSIQVEEMTEEGYRTYSVPAAEATAFIHFDIAKKPTTVLKGAFIPSSPGALRDLPNDPEFVDDFPADDLLAQSPFKDDANAINLKIRQCGVYAGWWAANRMGLTKTEFDERLAVRKEIRGYNTKSTNATDMDEQYADSGVRVDKTPAVGAIATWDAGDVLLGKAMGDPGHAAVVTRVYRLNKSDKAKADRLAKDEFVDGESLKKLVEAAAKSTEPKITYVLLEDYNGFGGDFTYGQKVMPAEWVTHYLHPISSPSAAPVTDAERIDRYEVTHPTLIGVYGKATGTETTNGVVKRTYEHGWVTYDKAAGTYDFEKNVRASAEQVQAIKAEGNKWESRKNVPAPTPQSRLADQVNQIGEQLKSVKERFAGRKQSTAISSVLATLTVRLEQLQRDLAAAQS